MGWDAVGSCRSGGVLWGTVGLSGWVFGRGRAGEDVGGVVRRWDILAVEPGMLFSFLILNFRCLYLDLT